MSEFNWHLLWLTAGFLGCMIVARLVLGSALARRLVSSPANPAHNSHVAPQAGGIAIAAVFLPALAWLTLELNPIPSGSQTGQLPYLMSLSIGFAGFAITGFLDDLHSIKAGRKLALFTLLSAAALLPLQAEIASWSQTAGEAAGFAGTALVFAAGVGFCLGTTNAVNFMDGRDMSISANLLPGIVMAMMMVPSGSLQTAFIVLLGAFAAFAWLNKPPARLFLGDAGSLPLGFAAFLIGSYFLFTRSTIAGFLPFAYVYADTATTMAARIVRRENLFAAHAGHAYQLARVNSRRWVSTLMGVAACMNTVLGMICLATGAGFIWQAAAFMIAAAVSIGLIIHFRRA